MIMLVLVLMLILDCSIGIGFLSLLLLFAWVIGDGIDYFLLILVVTRSDSGLIIMMISLLTHPNLMAMLPIYMPLPFLCL